MRAENDSFPQVISITFVVVLVGLLVFFNLSKVRYSEKQSQVITPGVLWHEVKVSGGDGTRTLWVYLPEHKNPGKMPCVFITQSGTSGFVGNHLDEISRAEHIPYVREGFAVVAYSMDGDLPDNPSYTDAMKAIKAFRAARSGVVNGQFAINYALNNIRNIDPDRLYAAGHSSAGTAALLLAESDHHINGALAYCPSCDVSKNAGDPFSKKLPSDYPDFANFLSECSPLSKASQLQCPVFLFLSQEDHVVDNQDTLTLAKKVKSHNNRVYLSTAQHGSHYDGMINQGLPQGIQWLKNGMPANDSR